MNTSKPLNSFANFNQNSSNFDQRFSNLIHSIFEAGAGRANDRIGNTDAEKRTREVKSDGGYKCIHLPIYEFVGLLNNVIAHRNWTPEQICRMRFLDVGCGVGEKVFLAQMFGFKGYGLELRPALIEEGTQLFKTVNGNLSHWESERNGGKNVETFIQGNALEFDKYSEFDVIYFYCPLFDTPLQQKLEERIARLAKPGTVVIGCLPKGVFAGGQGSYRPQNVSVSASELGWEYVHSQNTHWGFHICRSYSYDI